MSINAKKMQEILDLLKFKRINTDTVIMYFSERNMFEDLMKHFEFLVLQVTSWGNYYNESKRIFHSIPSQFLLPYVGSIISCSKKDYSCQWMCDGAESSREISDFFKELAIRILRENPEECLKYIDFLFSVWRDDSSVKKLLLFIRTEFSDRIPQKYNSLFEEMKLPDLKPEERVRAEEMLKCLENVFLRDDV